MVLLQVVGAPVATAHSELEETQPADGARLLKTPTEIELIFAEPVRQEGSGISANGPQGDRVLTPKVSGQTVRAQWPKRWQGGKFSVTYRIVSEDGHVVAGKFAFRIDAKSTAQTIEEPAQDSSVSAKDSGGVPIWVWLAGFLVLAVAGYGITQIPPTKDK